MSSSSFEQGQIIVAPIPFSTQVSAKIRPALVISKAEYNNKSEDIIVLKITGKGKDYPYDVSLRAADLEQGSLKHESVIQADFPVVIEKAGAARAVGKVSPKKLKEVKQKISELYAL